MNEQLADITLVFEDAENSDVLCHENGELNHPETKIKNEKKRTIDGVLIGTLVDIKNSSQPIIDYANNPTEKPMQAQSTTALDKSQIGREVLLSFVDQNPKRPVVIGLLEVYDDDTSGHSQGVVDVKHNNVSANVDGERLVFSAEKEIVLRCGDSSITLTRSGKIIIRGSYLLSRSTGVNRIKGGVVHIN